MALLIIELLIIALCFIIAVPLLFRGIVDIIALCFIIAVPLLLCGIVDYSVMFHNSCTIVVLWHC